jgi:hypothetical protein
VLTQELISMISGRLPVEVEKNIRKLMATYATNLTSILSQFPSQQVLSFTYSVRFVCFSLFVGTVWLIDR